MTLDPMTISPLLRAGMGATVTLTCMLTCPAPAAALPDDGTAPALTTAQRKVLLEATARFRDPRRAKAAGYLPTDHCVPGMGHHWMHPGHAADQAVDPVLPEILLYVPGRDGKPVLVAVEYFKADADGNLYTSGDRPTLFGRRFDGPMAGHEMPPGSPPMPVHYDLHVWLYQHNPVGELATENPRITCR